MATIFGTNGADVRTGTPDPDYIYGYPDGGDPEADIGDDILTGVGDDDSIFGGGGNDTIVNAFYAEGNAGDDSIAVATFGDTTQSFGGGGNDTLTGNDNRNDLFDDDNGAPYGDDIINAYGGDDYMESNGGRDTIDGGTGEDYIQINRGDATFTVVLAASRARVISVNDGTTARNVENVVVSGGSQGDTLDLRNMGGEFGGISGNGGRDLIYGARAGVSTLNGGDGDDTIYASTSEDVISGGAGEDTIVDFGGNARISGGDDNDTIILKSEFQAGGVYITGRTVHGDAGDDLLTGSQHGPETLFGDAGNDTIRGNEETDIISGGADDDFLDGGSGDDQVAGDDGNDQLFGRDGDDTLTGGDGEDRLGGGAGNDSLDGGSGNDRLSGESGEDILVGGIGSDEADGGADNDLVSGGADADKLHGRAGDDLLIGGGGQDDITGGSGADNFIFTVRDGTYDLVRDFVSGEDTVVLYGLGLDPLSEGDNLIIGAGAAATTGDATVLYDTATGRLCFDADGTGSGAAELLAILSGKPALTAGDFSLAVTGGGPASIGGGIDVYL